MTKRKSDWISTPSDPEDITFLNVRVLDVERGCLLPAQSVRISDGLIVAMGEDIKPCVNDRCIDAKGKTLMPGLIDMHVHVTAWSANFSNLTREATTYTTIKACHIMRSMLYRGFTSVRDAGGADFGLAQAVEEGLVVGPRLFFCGHALSQTGGHGDMRGPGEVWAPCCCPHGLGMVCDGVAEMRRACREEIRKGATQIKLMVSGGVASPCDRIDSTQFHEDEIRAAVQEADAANLYVMAHAYTARAVNRALQCGVRSIEHGNLLDESSVALFKEKQAFYVPTLATYFALQEEGIQNGMPKDQHAKVRRVLDSGMYALQLAHEGGVKICFGTDCLADMHKHQLNGLALHARIQPPADVIRTATCTCASLLNRAGKLGVVQVGAAADLLLIDGDPLKEIAILQDPEKRLCVIMKGGVIYKEVL
eukprot:gnl/MRDRNA2_/MRDRNA2_58301_c0_seq1.p1 gnl/MRDRNA2_/MRDRNA2_58301_c0~~gnl/MRDRNA2_/MRDRNA2_58301_c0_seq1.p1  ORF type:complete len:422 (-),score=76.14 gnl/MRDRNA2_/MRDRNA2_58301_c0_seq1:201-1466(-)